VKFYHSARFIRTVKSLGKVAIVGLVAGGILTFIGLQYSAKPEFCTVCHYMDPFYDSWKTSSHKMVPCVECHYPPSVGEELKGKLKAVTSFVQYFTGVYGKSRPWVEISDNSCLREGCHNRRLLLGRENFGRILFDHTPHLSEIKRGIKLRCTSCHSQIVQGKHMTVTTSTCFLCHFKRVAGEKTLDDCNTCHGAPLSPVQYLGVKFDHSEALKRGVECRNCHMNVTQGNGEVSKDRCFSCHSEPEKLEKYTDATLMHDNHVTRHKVDCLRCHDQIRHQVSEAAESVQMECTSCHPNHHQAQKELYLGVGGHGVDYMPDPMFLVRVNCTSCHISHQGNLYQGKTAFPSPAACIACHGTEYAEMLDQWKTQMKRNLSIIVPSLAEAQRRWSEAGKDSVNRRQAKDLLDQASDNINLVRYGKGVHNVKYAVGLLGQSNSMIKQAMRLIDSSFRPAELSFSQASLQSECYNCHLDVEKKKPKIFGSVFDHEIHLRKANVGCDNCHSNQRVHGELIISKAECTSCHHREEKIECSVCHGDGPAEPIEYKSIDFQHNVHTQTLGMICSDCHQRGDGQIKLTPDLDCYNCHHPLEQKECQDCHKEKEMMESQ
jgi:nitrate/TMAO reductase-like tetraheme cytochrome c subunit